jgi:transposase InsO family protein
VIDASALHMVLAVLTGWLDRQERQAIAYLMEENRVLRRQLSQQRLQFTDADRRRLAVRGYRLGRQVLLQIATIVTPDTILRWHRQLIVRKWTYPSKCAGRQRVLAEIRRLVVRMAEENPTCGYTRIQGALKNVGHRVGRSTIARILKADGLPPVPARPTSWQTFLRAHWGAIAGADFFTTEVWTWRGLVTFYTVFVIDLASRRVEIVGSTRYPNDFFMRQVSRTLIATDGLLSDHRVLICDRDRKWSREVRRELDDAGVYVALTPFQSPNASAHAERFVRSIKYECLDRMVPLGERHFRRALKEFTDHYHRERNHQGLENRLIEESAPYRRAGRIRRRPRLGGLLNLLRACGVTTGARPGAHSAEIWNTTGVYPDPGCIEESWSSRRAVDDRDDSA